MKMTKMKKYPVVQLMSHNMLLEIEVEVEIVVLIIIWVIDYYKGGQVEVEVSHHRQEQQVVLKQLPKENNLNDYTFTISWRIKGLG